MELQLCGLFSSVEAPPQSDTLCPFFFIFLLFIPSIVSAIFFLLSLPRRNSDPGSRSMIFSSLPTTVRAFSFIATRLQPFLLSSGSHRIALKVRDARDVCLVDKHPTCSISALRGARVYGHTATATCENSTPPPPTPPQHGSGR